MRSVKNLFKNTMGIFKKMNTLTRICLVLALITIIFVLCKSLPTVEGFEDGKQSMQSEKYKVLKDNDIYDDFYVDIYDQLVYSGNKNDFEIKELRDRTNLDKNSVVLDVGSGTGRHCKLIKELGSKCVGIDKSGAMIRKAKDNCPGVKFIKDDVIKTMTFQGNSFTHITAFYFTLYYIKQKLQFFKNAFHWLKPGGFLVIHLVNKHKFDPIIPAGDPLIFLSAQKYSKKRITDTVVEFEKFKYKANFNLINDNKAKFNEKFVFPNGNVRHNEHVLFMDDQSKILGLAKDVGFILQAKIDLTKCQYERQYLYVLQKPN
tara:strand:- start:791 stop:1741 length:951 start_codon:yes stop_codon:yes gene_type:complete